MGETCDACPKDCKVGRCTETTPLRTVAVNLAIPSGKTVTGATIFLGYRSTTVSFPGSDLVTSSTRIKNKPPGAIFAANDKDYGLNLVFSTSGALASGRVLTIDFDSCRNAEAPTTADFGCAVQCANSFGLVQGCTCTVQIQ